MDSTIEDIGSSKGLYDDDREVVHWENTDQKQYKIIKNERCNQATGALNLLTSTNYNR